MIARDLADLNLKGAVFITFLAKYLKNLTESIKRVLILKTRHTSKRPFSLIILGLIWRS